MNRLELDLMTSAVCDPRTAKPREKLCPRCQTRLTAFGTHDVHVCERGHQFTRKQLVEHWSAKG